MSRNSSRKGVDVICGDEKEIVKAVIIVKRRPIPMNRMNGTVPCILTVKCDKKKVRRVFLNQDRIYWNSS